MSMRNVERVPTALVEELDHVFRDVPGEVDTVHLGGLLMDLAAATNLMRREPTTINARR